MKDRDETLCPVETDAEDTQDPWADIARQNAAQAAATQTGWDMTIRERAAQRAAEHGTTQEAEEGRILARYVQRMAAVQRQYMTVDAMYEQHIADLRDQLTGIREALARAEYERAQVPLQVADLNRRDAMAVAQYLEEAPQFQQGGRKSWATPWGKLSRRTKTTSAQFVRADVPEAEDLLVSAFVDVPGAVRVTAKPVWAEIRKRLVPTLEGGCLYADSDVAERLTVCRDGTVIDIDTGEAVTAIVVPAEAVQYKQGSSEEHYHVEIGSTKLDLREATITDGRNTAGPATAADSTAGDAGDGYGPEDPFGPDAE